MDRKSWILESCRRILDSQIPMVLDVGSANGWIFKDSNIKTVSVDLDVYKLPFFVRADAHHLPFKRKAFKVAVLGEILEHVENPVAVLKEAKRVAENVLVTVPIEGEWDLKHKPFWPIEKRLEEEGLTLEELYVRDNPGVKSLCLVDGLKHGYHQRYYDDALLKKHLSQAGMKGAAVEPLRYEGWSFRVVTYPKPKEKVKGKLKIALISTPFLRTPPDSYGGLELIVANLAEALAKMGHEVTVFAAEGSKVEGCKVVSFGPPTLKVQVDWLEAEWKAYNVYRDMLEDFDIIHGHNWFGFEYAAKARNPKLKVLHTHHGHLNLEWWGRSKPPFKLNLVAISKWMSKAYKALGFESQYVYNGINLDKYPFQKEKGDRLLFVGRIDRFKQPHVAIEVARKLGLGLDVVGGTFVQDPDYLREIRSMCDGRQVRFYPDAPHELKVKLLQNAKALLLPSKMGGEPFGLVAVEAMSCGTPVVALNDGAIPEVVREGGIVCDVYDVHFSKDGPFVRVKRNPVDALVEAVEKVDSVKPSDCRRNAERFSREAMAENYVKLYRDILAGSEW